MAVIYGSFGDDALTGTDADDVIHGGPSPNPSIDIGRDFIDGGAGNDLIFGYGGEDHLNGGTGDDEVHGGLDDDTIDDGSGGSTAGNDRLFGDEGDDTIYSYGGIDQLDGGTGNDLAIIDRSLATANLTFVAGPGIVTILGDGTTLTGFESYRFVAGAGDDVLTAPGSLTGGDGDDRLTLLTPPGGGRVFGFGGAGDDVIDGSALAASVILVADGGTGDDVIIGGAGNDDLSGGGGNDSIFGGAGVDTISCEFSAVPLAVTLSGGDGSDIIQATGAVADITAASLDGGAGNDWFVFTGSLLITTGTTQFVDFVRLDLRLAAAVVLGTAGDNLFDFGAFQVTSFSTPRGVTLFAGDGADTVTGTSQGDVISGEAGNDVLSGGDGSDVLLGGTGRDVLDGGAGADTLAGGPGKDTYYVDDPSDVVTEAPGEGTDTVISLRDWTLGENVERLTLAGTENLAGTGNALKNTLTGNDGANILAGLDGDDLLKGGKGDDVLEGGDGKDTLLGGRGSDTLTGGAGRDVFQWLAGNEGGDVVTDFAHGDDKLQVSAAGFGGGLTEGMSLGASGRFVAGTSATQAFGQFLFDAATGVLAWDADGTGGGASVVIATLNTALVAGDMVVIG
jgi:Ca2+-binding RTX toxin-like protein